MQTLIKSLPSGKYKDTFSKYTECLSFSKWSFRYGYMQMALTLLLWFGAISCTEKIDDDTASNDNKIVDGDNDGLSDDEELSLGTDPNNPDSDGDGLGDSKEIREGTDPNSPDSDGDGFDDAFEIQFNTDPMDPNDFPIIPEMGLWTHQNPLFTTDDCNLESILQDRDSDIFQFVPQTFETIDTSPDFFLIRSLHGSMCTITGDEFFCEPIYNAVLLHNPSVTLELNLIMRGMLLGSDQIDSSTEIQILNCDGDPLACGILSLEGVHIPCSSFVTTQASH